ncbi:MAG: UpxY family transcription antiterminator [Pirellulales bacterium]|nr:UpxY family transcription antiterminator [Pirellulales bacterium]
MPILPAETSIFPKDLLDESLVGLSDRCWWVIWTKARQEKAIARQLVQLEISFYLPLVFHENLIRNRRVRSHVPLFDGYVFLFASEEERQRVLNTNRVSRVLAVDNQEQLFNDLRQVSRLIKSNAPLTIERRLMPGRRVRVKTGAMLGLEGTIISRRGNSRLLVAVNFLQQSVSVAVDDFTVEPID